MLLATLSEVLRDCASDEENEDDSSSDPEGAVEIGVAIEDVKEVGAWVDRHATTAQDLRGVDVKKLGVKGERPEIAL